MVLEKLWQSGEVPTDRRRGSVTPVFEEGTEEDLGSRRTVSFPAVPGKLVVQISWKLCQGT